MATKITVEHLKTKLQKELSTTHLEIEDVSDGCGAKFVAKIVSPSFEGLSLIAQHRLVNQTIADEMVNIHSFSMKTLTPDKYAKSQT